MGVTLQPDTYRDWAAGVITSLRASEIPENASPRGLNSALVSLGNGKALVGVRKGAALVNTTTVVDGGSSPVEIRSLTPFYHASSNTYHRLFTTKDGQLRTLNDDDTTTTISGAFLTDDANPPLWTVLNDIAFLANGTDLKKVIVKSGVLTPQAIGITRPTVGSFAGAAGAAGTPNGTYEVVVTYGNSTTGHESSRSDTISVVLANQKLNLSNIPVSGDSQVDQRFIYVRNLASQVAYYRITTIANNSTTSLTGLDWVDANLTITAPDTAENNPPPSTDIFRGVIAHGQRLFGWSGTNLYYSKFDGQVCRPEAFDPEALEPISPKDGQVIVGCHRINDQTLIIFKERSMYGLFGTDPSSWEVRLIDPSVGLVSPRAVDTIEGVTYFVSQLGPMLWDQANAPVQVGYAKIAPDIAPEMLSATEMTRAIVIADPPRQRVQFIIATAGSPTACDTMLPFNYRLAAFEAESWQPFDVASAARMVDSSGRQFVYLGGYYGKIFKWWAADVDGARVADAGGNAFTLATSVAAASSSTTFTVQATDTLDGTNLIGLYLYLFDAGLTTYQRRRITAAENITKQITVTPALATTPAAGQHVVIATPVFEWDSKSQDNEQPFLMKRFFHVFAQGVCESGATIAYVDVFLNGSTAAPQRTFTFSIAGTGAQFDIAKFDVDTFAVESISRMKSRIAKIGYAYRLRVRHFTPNRPFVLLMLGVQSHAQNYRSQ